MLKLSLRRSRPGYRPVLPDPACDAITDIVDLRVAHLFNQETCQRTGSAASVADQDDRIMLAIRCGETLDEIRLQTIAGIGKGQ